MTKDEFAALLTEKGFRAKNEDGVVLIRKDDPLTTEEIKLILQLIKETGYSSSFGWRTGKGPAV